MFVARGVETIFTRMYLHPASTKAIFWCLIFEAVENPKKPFPDLGPLQSADLGWRVKAIGFGGSGPKAHSVTGYMGLGHGGPEAASAGQRAALAT